MSVEAERYARLHALFRAARALDGAARAELLTERCGSDAELRRELEELLAASDDEDDSDAFSEAGIARARGVLEGLVPDARRGAPSDADWLPERVGRYRILRKIGAGGMGIVYEAEQDSPRRRVAIKLLHPQQSTPERRRRFQREAELLGRLQHPGIAQIHEAGTFDLGRGEQPFFAMELVDGVGMRVFAERQRLDARGRLALLARVADAVHHAHERGVIHRDLKPDNVLVDERGQPKVLDFGVARAREGSDVVSTFLTEAGVLLGTLAYMAPEQLTSDGAVTPRTDVYALGVIAFELLSGRLPHEIGALQLPAALKVLADDPAFSLGALEPGLRGDVETIVSKALQREPARRYASASALAVDLRAHLSDQPIHARPPSRYYRAQKFARRHRTLVVGTLATVLSLVLGILFSVRYAMRAADRASELATTLYHAEMLVASELAQSPGGIRQLRSIVAHWLPSSERSDLRGWEWRLFRSIVEPRSTVLHPRGIVNTLDWHAREPWLVEAGIGGLSVRDLESGSVLTEIDGPGYFFAARWSPDGARLAYCVWDHPKGKVCVLEAGGWTEVWMSPLEASHFRGDDLPQGIAWHPDGRRLAWLDFLGILHLVDLQTGAVHTLDGNRTSAEGFAFDPAGERLAILDEGVLRLFETREWSAVGSWPLYDSGIMSGLAWDPAGERMATVNSGSPVHVLSVAGGSILGTSDTSLGGNSVAWSPGGDRIATPCTDNAVRVWDAQTMKELDVLLGHEREVHAVAWGPSDDRLASGGMDGTVRLWNLKDEPPVRSMRIPNVHGQSRGGVAWDPAGERLAVQLGGSTQVWSAEGDVVGQVPLCAQWAPDGSGLFGIEESRIRKGSPESPTPTILHETILHESGQNLDLIRAHPTENRVVYTNLKQVWSLDLDTGVSARLGPPMSVTDLDWSADGTVLGVIGAYRIFVIEWDTGRVLLDGPAAEFRTIACSSDGSRLALGAFDHAAHILELRDPASLTRLEGHTLMITDMAWHPDGSRLATASLDGTVKLWDPASGSLCASLRMDAAVVGVGWSPTGDRLCAVDGNGGVRVWSAFESLPDAFLSASLRDSVGSAPTLGAAPR